MEHSKKYAHLRCFHAIPLEQLSLSEIVADPMYSDDTDSELAMDDRTAFRWLESRIGFYPLFLAIGNEEALYRTGYARQWEPPLSSEQDENGVQEHFRSDFPNLVLLVFKLDDVDESAVFTDFSWWCISMGDIWKDGDVMREVSLRLWKKSRKRTDWLRTAHRDGLAAQVLVPRMDMRKACQVWVRNNRTKELVEAMGFHNVIVKCVPADPWD